MKQNIKSFVLKGAMLLACTLYAELKVDFGAGGTTGGPISVSLSNLGGSSLSDDAGSVVSGSLSGVGGTLVFEAATANVANDGNWSVGGNDLQIHTTFRITGFTTDVVASPDYIVDGASRANLAAGTVVTVNTPLTSGQQIGWSSNQADKERP
ncbi:MAG: hypothetical protein K9M45_05725 [Kiritimatiellales bacterium]|nr:hypothetical protein [Kiritimatiellales bacterium]